MFVINATDYAPVTPVTPPCDIIPIFIGYKGENKARCLVFDLTDCVEEFGDGNFAISFLRHGDAQPYLVTDTDQLDYTAIWEINSTDTAVDGYGLVQLQYIVDDVVCKSALYRTVTFESNGITGDVPDPYEDLLAQIAAYASTAQSSAAAAVAAAATATTAVEEGVKTERSQRIAADDGLSARIDSLQASVGAPLTTTQASAMTDVNKIYVYTGSETGYTFGNWYYYNGAEWVSGGVYNSQALETDKTLTVSDMAADAAVVGDRIDECMSAFVVNSASGDIASFADGADNVPVKDLVVNISPVQSGTGDPSPTNVRPITGWDSVGVTVVGKNFLANVFDSTYTQNGITATGDGEGNITLNGTATAGTIAVTNLATGATATSQQNNAKKNIPNGTYKVVITGSTAVRLQVFGSNSTDAGGSGLTAIFSSNTGTFTIDDTYAYNWCRLLIPSGSTFTNTTITLMVMDSTETDSTYEPYQGKTYPITFPTSAGTVYGGTLDVTNGVLTVTHKTVTINGSEQYWYSVNNYPNIYNVTFVDMESMPVHQTTDILTNQGFTATAYSYNTMEANIPSICTRANETSIWRFYLATEYTTLASLRSYLATNPLQVVYPLQNPVSYQLTATEIKTLLGNNNIWSDTGSVASLEYRADTKLYIEKLTTPDDDMVANANITSGSYFMVGNNLYLATAAIASGASIVPGTNCTLTNLAAALNAINS